jgi:hypothetical protein
MIGLTRRLTRQSDAIDRRSGRPYVIQLEAGGKLVRIKLKGCRLWYTVTVEQLFLEGARNAAAEIRAERFQRRMARRQAGGLHR